MCMTVKEFQSHEPGHIAANLNQMVKNATNKYTRLSSVSYLHDV